MIRNIQRIRGGGKKYLLTLLLVVGLHFIFPNEVQAYYKKEIEVMLDLSIILPNNNLVSARQSNNELLILTPELNIIKNIPLSLNDGTIRSIDYSNYNNIIVTLSRPQYQNTIYVFDINGNLKHKFKISNEQEQLQEVSNDRYVYFIRGDSTFIKVVDKYGNILFDHRLSNNRDTISGVKLYKNNKLYFKCSSIEYILNLNNYMLKTPVEPSDLQEGLENDKGNIIYLSVAGGTSYINNNNIKLVSTSKGLLIYKNNICDTKYYYNSLYTMLGFVYNPKIDKLYYILNRGGEFSSNLLGWTYPLDALTDLKVTDINENQATIIFNKNNNHASVNYVLEYKEIGSGNWIRFSSNNADKVTLSNLLPDTNYEIRARTDFLELISLPIHDTSDYWKTVKFRTKTTLQVDLENIFKLDKEYTGNRVVSKNINGNHYLDQEKTFSNIFNKIDSIDTSLVQIISLKGTNNATATKTGTFTVNIDALGATQFRVKTDNTNWTEWTANNNITVTGLSKGVRIITVEAKNKSGKTHTKTMTVFSL